MRIALAGPVLSIYGNYMTSIYSSYWSIWYRSYPYDKFFLYIVALKLNKSAMVNTVLRMWERKKTVIVSVDNVLALILVWINIPRSRVIAWLFSAYVEIMTQKSRLLSYKLINIFLSSPVDRQIFVSCKENNH